MTDVKAIVDESELRAAVSGRAGALLDAAGRVAALRGEDVDAAIALLSRPLLSVILSDASQLEELLDAYGALGNDRWRPLRSASAALKLFAQVHYSLVHLAHALPLYRLLPVEGELPARLGEARRFTARVLHTASRRLLSAAAPLGLAAQAVEVCAERLPPGRLPQDSARRHVDDVAGTVARIATAFLNLAEESGVLAAAARPAAGDAWRPALPREHELRRLSEDFHNLQALYDTHVAQTDVEQADPELPSLRGHASVVYHLLDIATALTHHHERHVLHAAPANGGRLFAHEPDCIAPEQLEAVLRDGALAFAARYLGAGRTLAQQLLRRYAEQGEITVPVPRYRGFHVRPSTLVARVTYHYGSPVQMRLEDEDYDASSPLELFRANELINAKKRRWLAQEIEQLVDRTVQRLGDGLGSPARTVWMVLMRLAEEGKVVLYEQPLPPIEGQLGEGQSVLSFVVGAVARLQALGKIDIVTPVTALFRGDRRVLADLELLAASGYGEDAYGNNVPLPEALWYLRR